MAATTVRGEANKRPNWAQKGRDHAVRQHGIGGLGAVTRCGTSELGKGGIYYLATYYRGASETVSYTERLRDMQSAFDWVDEKFAETAEQGRRH
jgi:hypothetical protein